MKANPINLFFQILTISVLLQSCNSDDSNEFTDELETLNTEISLSSSTTELITEWNQLWVELDQNTSGMRPNATARALAYIHLAAYETALFDLNGYVSNTTRLEGLNINPERRRGDINLEVALNQCYARVINHFMFSITSNKSSIINELRTSNDEQMNEVLSETVMRGSRQWGNYVADRIIAYSRTDIEAETQILDPQPFSYEPPVGDGFWTYSADEERAWFPYWASARTFVISPEQTSSVPPPLEYSVAPGSGYYNEMLEVYDLSTAARLEDNEDLWIAEFWSDDVEGLMMSPPGRQFSIANQLIKSHDLSHENALYMLMKLGFSLNDACVSTWQDKYNYMVMRPNVYIQEFIDASYQTNLYRFIYWPNPSFPGYPSGHSSFASAAAGIFIQEFGDALSFTDRSHEGRTEFRSEPRTFDSFSEMAEENAFSRVPFGVHIRMDCTEGLRLGYEVSDAVNALELDNGSF